MPFKVLHLTPFSVPSKHPKIQRSIFHWIGCWVCGKDYAIGWTLWHMARKSSFSLYSDTKTWQRHNALSLLLAFTGTLQCYARKFFYQRCVCADRFALFCVFLGQPFVIPKHVPSHTTQQEAAQRFSLSVRSLLLSSWCVFILPMPVCWRRGLNTQVLIWPVFCVLILGLAQDGETGRKRQKEKSEGEREFEGEIESSATVWLSLSPSSCTSE